MRCRQSGRCLPTSFRMMFAATRSGGPVDTAFLEAREADVDGLTAPLDEAVGVERDDGAGRERDRRRAPRLDSSVLRSEG